MFYNCRELKIFSQFNSYDVLAGGIRPGPSLDRRAAASID